MRFDPYCAPGAALLTIKTHVDSLFTYLLKAACMEFCFWRIVSCLRAEICMSYNFLCKKHAHTKIRKGRMHAYSYKHIRFQIGPAVLCLWKKIKLGKLKYNHRRSWPNRSISFLLRTLKVAFLNHLKVIHKEESTSSIKIILKHKSDIFFWIWSHVHPLVSNHLFCQILLAYAILPLTPYYIV
jgi:hypothetical protein